MKTQGSTVPGPRPKRSLGQHFLSDGRVAAAILAECSARASTAQGILEVGPGTGALTTGLLSMGLPMVAVEMDDRLAGDLGRRFPGLRVLADDARFVDLDALAGGAGPERWLVVGNLPYNAGTAIARRILAQPRRVAAAVWMLQLEVVRKLVAGPGEASYGALAAWLGAWWLPRRCFDVPPGAFRPPPKVTSAVCAFEPLEQPLLPPGEAPDFEKFLARAFAQPRKTLMANLLRGGAERAYWTSLMDSLSLDGKVRPGEVSPGQFAGLYARWKGEARTSASGHHEEVGGGLGQ